ncbi:hypothetical protein MLD38_021881 [Melastoma candidum]|uniref:Uncharacterized protein n=1 Tax=Melastoma candidum TaxID=119954 RepID=A0ACB9QKW3_9MYRT|nr:hypothetical protein MLD38_021881 [Melastoma candidum]
MRFFSLFIPLLILPIVIARSYDHETVTFHEIGHLLGLGHSSVPGAIMYPNITPGTSKGQHAKDVEGIKALYNF